MHALTLRYVLVLSLVGAACGGGDPGALEPPDVDAVEGPTNQNPFPLTGSGEPGATLEVRGGADPVASGSVDDAGRFTVAVPLRADTANTLIVSQRIGSVESSVVMVSVTHDGTPPAMPTLEDVPTPTRRTVVRLRGTTEALARVVVTDAVEEEHEVQADADGAFEIGVPLQHALADLTQNDLSVVAIDAAGNESAPLELTIIHNPNLPLEAPLLDDFPAATAESSVELTGEMDPLVTLRVSGGADESTEATSDAAGRFAITVALRANEPNVLGLVAVVAESGMMSAPTTITIVHDDVPPAAPEVDPPASPTGAELVTLTGFAEADALVRVMGGAEAAEDFADETGAFRVDVRLNADSANALRVVAIDAANNVSEETLVEITHDGTLPTPVHVDPFPSPTAENPITLTGRTEADADIEVLGGVGLATTTADGEGRWMLEVMLAPNTRNELRVRRVDGEAETLVVVVHDDIPPTAPLLDPVASPTSRTTFELTGTSEPFARLTVNGGVGVGTATASAIGRFAVSVTIDEDDTTTLMATATDRAGNASPTSSVSVTHSSSVPPAPILDQSAPPPTNQATYIVAGRVAEPGEGVMVIVRGGSAEAMGPTNAATGRFSVEVTLSPNVENALSVVSLTGTIESAAAVATVVHDDIPPDAPNGDVISSGAAGSGVACLLASPSINGGAGAAEANARVDLRNTRTGTTRNTTAATNGSFSQAIPACGGDRIALTATDAAGNVSPETEVSVPTP